MAIPAKSPALHPLYKQIKDVIFERLTVGEWELGETLPTEAEFAAYYKVSQGTVRKAISELAAENLVIRQRGKGTFVASHTEERERSHFFHLCRDDGIREFPSTRKISCRRRKSDGAIEARLDLNRTTDVVVIERLRSIGGVPVDFETVIVPDTLFPEIAASYKESLPNELYPFYESRYGIRVIRATERLRAVTVGPREAKHLGLRTGIPLLEIDRVAFTYGEQPVEWRLSRCNTKNNHYLSTFS